MFNKKNKIITNQPGHRIPDFSGTGCEVDSAGRKVPAGSPLRLRPFVTAIVILTLLSGLCVAPLSFVILR